MQLIHACGVGDVGAVTDLINDGADVNCVGQDEDWVSINLAYMYINKCHCEIIIIAFGVVGFCGGDVVDEFQCSDIV